MTPFLLDLSEMFDLDRTMTTDLSEVFDLEILDAGRRVHLLLLLEQQHEEPTRHVAEQVAGTVRVHLAVARHRTLL